MKRIQRYVLYLHLKDTQILTKGVMIKNIDKAQELNGIEIFHVGHPYWKIKLYHQGEGFCQ